MVIIEIPQLKENMKEVVTAVRKRLLTEGIPFFIPLKKGVSQILKEELERIMPIKGMLNGKEIEITLDIKDVLDQNEKWFWEMYGADNLAK